jgi:hypothetical protein
MPTGIWVFAGVVASMILCTVLTHIGLNHRREMIKLKYLREGADYQRGVRAGMLKAARLLRSGEHATTSGPYTPSPCALAVMIEQAAPADPE